MPDSTLLLSYVFERNERPSWELLSYVRFGFWLRTTWLLLFLLEPLKVRKEVTGSHAILDSSVRNYTTFAARYISCNLPDRDTDPKLFELVSTRQWHHHTRNCKKKKGSTCRFAFPRCPSENTFVARVPTDENSSALENLASDVLTKIYAELLTLNTTNEPPTLKDLVTKIGITEQEYKTALSIAIRRTQLQPHKP